LDELLLYDEYLFTVSHLNRALIGLITVI